MSLAAVLAIVFARPSLESPSPGATLTGKVTFSGKAPVNTPWTVGKNRKVCSNSKTLDRIIVDKSGGVANCFIIVKGAKGSTAGMKPAVMEQKGCRFLPHAHVAAVNSSMTVTNDDDLLHNVHGYYVDGFTTAFNFAQPLEGQRTQLKLNKPGMIEIQCDAGHSWMSSYVYVTDHPFVDISEADGSFSIPNLPAGTYTVQCWHEGWKVVGEKEERPIFGPAKISEQTVTISGGSPAQVQFQLSE